MSGGLSPTDLQDRPPVVPGKTWRWGGRLIAAPLVAYVILCALLLGMLAMTARNGEWISDSWIHTATISEVARHPWHPLEPLTGEAVSFPYYSPWAMAAGWLLRLTGLSVFTVLTLSGLASTAAFLVAWYRLVRALSDAPWAPLFCLLGLLLLWGTGQWYWSGFPSLGTLSVGFTWPSVLAAALWFELWRAALRLGDIGPVPLVVAFLVLPGLILLIHPFTAVVAAISVAATLVGQWSARRPRVLGAAVLAVLSGLLASAWPWMDLRTLTNSGDFDGIHALLYGWGRFPMRWVLVALTVPALLVRLRRNHLDPLAWTSAGCGAGVLVGGVTREWSLGRLGTGIAIPGFLALGVLLAECVGQRDLLSPPARRMFQGLAALSCVALVIGAWANAWALARAVPDAGTRARAERLTRAAAPYLPTSWLAPYVHEGDVAVTNNWQLRRQLPTYGVRTVQLPWPSPAVPDAVARTRAENAIMAPRTPARTRERLLESYDVRWVVWTSSAKAPLWSAPGWGVAACGPERTVLLGRGSYDGRSC